MAVKTYDRFWNDRDGKEYGLIGQSTTSDTKGVALQVDEATGELLVRVPSTSPVTVEQSDSTKLKCEPVQTDQTKLIVTARGGGAAELATDAHAIDIKTAVETLAFEVVPTLGIPARPFLPQTEGATPTQQQGTPGRMNRDWTEDFGGAVTGVWHPLQHGVRIVETVGAGPVTASATGQTITIASIIAGTTTLAQIRAAIAADAPSALLASLTGDGTVDAGYTGQAGHDLWFSGTIPGNLFCALYPDGYVWPIEVDATGGMKVSQSSLQYGEGDSVPQLRVQRATFFGTTLAATGTGYATTCRLAALSVTNLTVAGTVTIRDGGAGGTVRYQNLAIAANGRIELDDVTFGTDVHITFAGGLTASVTPIVAPST